MLHARHTFSVQVDHAVVASQFTDSNGRETLAASHRQLRGFLVDSNCNVMRELSAPKRGRPDRVSHGDRTGGVCVVNNIRVYRYMYLTLLHLCKGGATYIAGCMQVANWVELVVSHTVTVITHCR